MRRAGIFVLRQFDRFARAELITDDILRETVDLMESGVIHADLGGSVFKQRIARPGGGKSGGYWTILAFKSGHRIVFLLGFSKNDLSNIAPNVLKTLKVTARDVLRLPDKEIEWLVAQQKLREIERNG